VFSFALPLLLLLAFFGRQFLNFNDIGLSNGFSHPLTGWDHLVTMLAVGIWAAQLRGRAIWMLPLAFVSVMSLGGLAGAAGLQIPNVDGVILLSCAVFSVLITRKIRFSSKINVLIVGFFAFFHGFAHGQEISTSASLISYTLGFMIATLLLHGAGILVAKLVVLAATCLLTVLFSNAALAKTAESVIDIKTNNAIGYQYQVTDSSQDFWLALRQNTYTRSNLGSGNYHSPNDLTCLDVDSSTLSSGISKLITPQLSDIANTHALSHKAKPNTGGDYYLITITNADLLVVDDNSTMQHFYPSYSSDCSNLDFKNYYPKINHTPGRHFLSNGVGLTSPPDLFSAFAVPLQFQIFSFSPIEASSLQASFAKFQIGNSVTHSLDLTNFNAPSLAISITGRQSVLKLRAVSAGFPIAPQCNYVTSKFICDRQYHQASLPVCTSKHPAVKKINQLGLKIFLSKHKSNQLDRLIKIIT
jgi:urease accessory protein